MPRRESTTSPRRLRAFQRQLDALALRLRGLTYRQIGEALGYRDRSGAFLAVQGAMQSVRCTLAKDALTLDIERLNDLTRAMLPRALSGDLIAISAVLAVMERRAALLNLNCPTNKRNFF